MAPEPLRRAHDAKPLRPGRRRLRSRRRALCARCSIKARGAHHPRFSRGLTRDLRELQDSRRFPQDSGHYAPPPHTPCSLDSLIVRPPALHFPALNGALQSTLAAVSVDSDSAGPGTPGRWHKSCLIKLRYVPGLCGGSVGGRTIGRLVRRGNQPRGRPTLRRSSC